MPKTEIEKLTAAVVRFLKELDRWKRIRRNDAEGAFAYHDRRKIVEADAEKARKALAKLVGRE